MTSPASSSGVTGCASAPSLAGWLVGTLGRFRSYKVLYCLWYCWDGGSVQEVPEEAVRTGVLASFHVVFTYSVSPLFPCKTIRFLYTLYCTCRQNISPKRWNKCSESVLVLRCRFSSSNSGVYYLFLLLFSALAPTRFICSSFHVPSYGPLLRRLNRKQACSTKKTRVHKHSPKEQ
jgi:hypothetical protein